MKRVLFLFAALLALGTAPMEAGSPGGCNCGRHSQTYCRLVCTMKSELTYEYSADCEPYCQLGPSDHCGKKKVCDNSIFGFHLESIWKPNCDCRVRNRHTLVKVPVVKQVPVYTCVVERVCNQCGCRHADARATQQLLDAGIMPVSVETPLVELDDSLRPVPRIQENATTTAVFEAPGVPDRNAAEAN